MALETIENTADGYTIHGTTRIGRPATIKINYSGKPKFEIDLQSFEGTEDPVFSETDLHHLMAETEALTLKLHGICETHWTEDTEVLLAKVISSIEQKEIAPETVAEMLEEQRALSMGM